MSGWFLALVRLAPGRFGMTLGVSHRRKAALRATLLQAAWNYDRMQNLGWAFCVEPALRQLYPDPALRAKALRRHLELFNTHPYLASYVLGAALRAEAQAVEGMGSVDAVSALKSGLSPALAAVGDSFFWANLRPAAGLLGVVWLWLAPHPWQLAAPLVFLAVYNLPSLPLRLRGVGVGWAKGEAVAVHVASMDLPAKAEGIRRAALVLVAGLAGSLARLKYPVGGGRPPLADNFLFLGAGLIMLLLLRLGVRPVVLLVLCVLAALVLALAIPQ
ncbi:MAG: PTS system mannose/fructose/sorbose family transporter subunit IID [bacterium]